jgi:putative ABC transport system permease protein
MKDSRRTRRPLGNDPERDVDDELSLHIEMRERELLERGETPERARELALRRFGDVETPRRECVAISERRGRRVRRRDHLSELGQDVRYAVRSLRRRPGFTFVAVLTLALGIGANSAIFSVVNGVLLRPLPFAHADRLYHVEMIYPDGQRYAALSAPDFASVAESNRVFEAIGAWTGQRAPVTGLGEPHEVPGLALSEGLLDMLGLRLAIGRSFEAEEHQPGRDGVVILDHGYWQREFGGSPDALGRSITFAGRTYEVIGVLAAESALPDQADLYVPLAEDETFSATAAAGRRSEYLSVVGRARPGLAEATVAADLLRVSQQLAEDFPDTNLRLTMGVRSTREAILGDVRQPLLILLGAVGFVLLVACANVANLLLARGTARREELSVRAALGAGRGRLLRQLLTEAVVLGLLGGAAALFVAWAGTRALVLAQPADIPRLDAIGVDTTVVLMTLATALLTSLLFGALPAFQAARAGISGTLREGGRGLGGGAGQRMRSGLVVAEMALAVVLLTGAGLLVRSFVEMTRVDPGFDAEQAVTFRGAMDQAGYAGGQEIRDFVGTLLDRVQAAPGVAVAGGAGVLPLQGRGALINFAVVGAPPPPDNVNAEIGLFSVTPGYFGAIGTRVTRGRDFATTDRSDAPLVAIINETGAAFWLPGEDPIGRRVQIGAGEREIVGVVPDMLQRDPVTPVMPQLYVPFEQRTTRSLQIVARTAGDPLAAAPSLRSLVRSMDPNMAVSEFMPLGSVVSEAVARPRFYTSLLVLFAALALLLAAVGIFGVMSYAVTQRTREISIRMALGAQRREVTRMIIGRSMLIAGLGVVAGLAAAAALSGVIRGQLYNVDPIDPLTIVAVVIVLVGAALLASYMPARRAAGVDPGVALRES